MERANIEQIKTLGFCLRMVPEVIGELVSDATKWVGGKIDDALDVWPED